MVVIAERCSFCNFISDAKNVIILESGWPERLERENKSIDKLPPTNELTLDNLAYIVYSSGTTGKPKGKVKREYSVIIRDNFCYCCIKTYIVTPHLNRLNETVQMRGHNIWFQ